MDYTPDDYEALFGKDYQPKEWTLGRLTLLVICLGLILASWGIAGCDAQDAANAAQSEKVAHEEAQIVLGHPCTYVAQCSRIVLACPVEARQCVKAGAE